MDVKTALSGTIEADVLKVPFSGHLLLERPMFNKGSAFAEAERRELGCLGLLPPHEETLEDPVSRAFQELGASRGTTSLLDSSTASTTNAGPVRPWQRCFANKGS